MDDKRKAFDEWCRTTSFYSTETMGGRYVSTHAGAAWEAWQAATAAREREVEELREELAAAKSFPFAAYMEIADLRARWYAAVEAEGSEWAEEIRKAADEGREKP